MKKFFKRRSSRRSARGQAMVEYSAINWILVMLLLTMMTVPMPMFAGQKNLIDVFFTAYQVYYDSFYFVLNMPFP